ncbi:MAG: methylmalonyl-CoA epimerase [Deltaproteobacteria bacterium]|nr:methylmalonyl-CoA epimerase [Deltaproteobacteria bacterium]
MGEEEHEDPTPTPRFVLDHVSVAVRDLDAAVAQYQALGLVPRGRESVPSEGAEVAFFDLGATRLELVTPCTPDAPIARSLDKRGEGLHHIALRVPDLDAALARVKAAGLSVVHDGPTPGAGATRVAFVHPKGLSGVLVEFVEKADPRGAG